MDSSFSAFDSYFRWDLRKTVKAFALHKCSMYARDEGSNRTYLTAAAFITLFSTPPLDETCGPIFHWFVTLGAKSSSVGSHSGPFLRLVRFGVFGKTSSSPSVVASDSASTCFRFGGRGFSSKLEVKGVREERRSTRTWAAVTSALRLARFVVAAIVAAILERLLRAMAKTCHK